MTQFEKGKEYDIITFLVSVTIAVFLGSEYESQ